MMSGWPLLAAAGTAAYCLWWLGAESGRKFRASLLLSEAAYELDHLTAELDRIGLAYIEATNSGIDMDEVARIRAALR